MKTKFLLSEVIGTHLFRARPPGALISERNPKDSCQTPVLHLSVSGGARQAETIARGDVTVSGEAADGIEGFEIDACAIEDGIIHVVPDDLAEDDLVVVRLGPDDDGLSGSCTRSWPSLRQLVGLRCRSSRWA